MKHRNALAILIPCLLLFACESAPKEVHVFSQCDIAKFQQGNFIKGMEGLRALSSGDTAGATIYFESLVYNAATDMLECETYRTEPKLAIWLLELSDYRKAHPRPPQARSAVDARLDSLLADFETKTRGQGTTR